MGCDIHAYIEYSDASDNRPLDHPSRWWRSFGGEINLDRYYEVFGRLAGVRAAQPAGMVPPRGLPAGNMAYRAHHDYWLRLVTQEAKDSGIEGVTEKQAEHWRGTRRKEIAGVTYVSHPDWHQPSWLTPEEWAKAVKGAGGAYKAATAAMKALKAAGNHVRIVFWFDN